MNVYELIEAGTNTYYINSPSRVGIFCMDEGNVCLVDSGNDKDAGKKIFKIVTGQGWNVSMILNTHSHADHIGGNGFLQQKTGCAIYGSGIDLAFMRNPILEPSYLFGGYPCKELRNKFLMAQPSDVQELLPSFLPQGLEAIHLDGHSFSMLGIRTSDDVWFLADSLVGPHILEKYHIPFLYDVEKYLETLDRIEKLEGTLFVPAHAEPTADIRQLTWINRNKILEIIQTVEAICKTPMPFEDILQKVFDRYHLVMDINQYVLVGSTIRSFLSYLHDRDRLDMKVTDNKLLWGTKQTDRP